MSFQPQWKEIKNKRKIWKFTHMGEVNNPHLKKQWYKEVTTREIRKYFDMNESENSIPKLMGYKNSKSFVSLLH